MKRISEKYLLDWLKSSRRKPLIIRGARQVGKSTLVRQFAAAQGLTLAEVNCERHHRLDEIFRTNQIPKIRLELEAATGKSLDAKNTLLFLDEVQATPYALPALRYFFEDWPTLPVIAAGSLLEFVLAEHGFSMPVGRVEYLHLGPMGFREFLLATGSHALIDSLDHYQLGDHFPLMAHEQLLERQRQFLFLGGMPESILAFTQTGGLLESWSIHQSILHTYQDDFAKYTKPGLERHLVQKVIDSVPSLVGHKVIYQHVVREARSLQVRTAIDLLIKARLLLPVYHSHCSGIPLRANQVDEIYKLYFLDVGLLNSLCGLEWGALSELSERTLINEGVLAEQYVAQHLAYRSDGREAPSLHYWIREGRSNNAEVDFVVTIGQKIVPVEVKAGKSGELRSLQQLVAHSHLKEAIRFDLNPPSLQKVRHKLTGPAHGGQPVAFQLISLPLYAVEWMEQWMHR